MSFRTRVRGRKRTRVRVYGTFTVLGAGIDRKADWSIKSISLFPQSSYREPAANLDVKIAGKEIVQAHQASPPSIRAECRDSEKWP